jgi:large subunit ribosomal protein L15
LKFEGADIFKAQINIEVQWITSELTLAAIERNGGVITTKYYDLNSVNAMRDPLSFFKSGKPIPRNGIPPINALEFYTTPENRGYLANPDLIRQERLKLAQKYGYHLRDIAVQHLKDMLNMRKDPRQIWFGLEPGWVVNLKEKTILKPTDDKWIEYYKS